MGLNITYEQSPILSFPAPATQSVVGLSHRLYHPNLNELAGINPYIRHGHSTTTIAASNGPPLLITIVHHRDHRITGSDILSASFSPSYTSEKSISPPSAIERTNSAHNHPLK